MERYYCNFPEEIVKLIGEYSSQEICVNYKYEICYIINECISCKCPIIFGGSFDKCQECRLKTHRNLYNWQKMVFHLENGRQQNRLMGRMFGYNYNYRYNYRLRRNYRNYTLIQRNIFGYNIYETRYLSIYKYNKYKLYNNNIISFKKCLDNYENYKIF